MLDEPVPRRSVVTMPQQKATLSRNTTPSDKEFRHFDSSLCVHEARRNLCGWSAFGEALPQTAAPLRAQRRSRFTIGVSNPALFAKPSN
jgi:hypothetical protein